MSKYQLRQIALNLLVRIEQEGSYSHLLITKEMENKRMHEDDKRLLTEIVYGTIERKITLDYYLEPFVYHKKLDKWVRMLLRMSVYQLYFLDKIPAYAIIHEAVEIAKKRGHRGISSMVNGVLRNMQRKGLRDIDEITDPIKHLSIKTSHPVWLIKRWVELYGFQLTKEMCTENLVQKPLTVRIQPLKITREEAMLILQEQGYIVEASSLAKHGIIIRKGNIFKSSLYSEGYLMIQDETSMLAAQLLNVQPGMKVLDTCSAPGGKTTHMAEIMKNEGVIHAYDLHENKLKLIRKQAKLRDLIIIQPRQGDARQIHHHYEKETFDRILVDAPCSGLGVIRSKPDIKYNKSLADIQKLSKVQLDILQSVAKLLKNDGYLMYCTCTVDKLENEEVVKAFLENHRNFKIDEQFFAEIPASLQNTPGISKFGLQIFPQTVQTNGFFLTRLVKNEVS